MPEPLPEPLPNPLPEPLPHPSGFGLTKAAYTVNECVEMLNISESSFYRMVRAGEIRVCRFGVKTLVQTPDLLRFLVSLRERDVEPQRKRPFDSNFPNDIASRRARQRALEKEAKLAKNGKPPPARFPTRLQRTPGEIAAGNVRLPPSPPRAEIVAKHARRGEREQEARSPRRKAEEERV
jgi:excisionase family DNA binding protein